MDEQAIRRKTEYGFILIMEGNPDDCTCEFYGYIKQGVYELFASMSYDKDDNLLEIVDEVEKTNDLSRFGPEKLVSVEMKEKEWDALIQQRPKIEDETAREALDIIENHLTA